MRCLILIRNFMEGYQQVRIPHPKSHPAFIKVTVCHVSVPASRCSSPCVVLLMPMKWKRSLAVLPSITSER